MVLKTAEEVFCVIVSSEAWYTLRAHTLETLRGFLCVGVCGCVFVCLNERKVSFVAICAVI